MTAERENQWNELEQESLAFLAEDFVVDQAVEVGVQVPASERLGELYLNGLLPLLCATVVAFAVSSRGNLVLSLLSSGLMAPLLTWFLRPFVCRASVAREVLLLALSLFVLPFAATSTVIPALALVHLEGGFVHPELLFILLQERFESALSIPMLLFYPGTVVTLAILLGRVRRSLPWCEPREITAFSRAWRLCLVALVSLGILAALWDYRPLNRTERSWIHNVQNKLQSQPYFELPETSEDKFWHDRFEADKNDLNADTSELDPDQHPPSSREEHLAAGSYFFRRVVEDENNPSFHFAGLKLHFQARPTGDNLYLNERLPWIMNVLATSEASQGQLESWLREVRELKDLLFDRETELDSQVYRILFSRESQHVNEGPIGWQNGKAWSSVIPNLKSHWMYKGTSPAKEFRVLGTVFETSPTRVLNAAYKRKLLRDWLACKPEVVALSYPDQKVFLSTVRDNLSQEGTTADNLWRSLTLSYGVIEENQALETCEAILALRLYRVKNHRLPIALSDLDLPGAKTSRFSLKTEADQVTLHDSATKYTFRLKAEQR